jgi:hypothetical protein
MTLESAMQLTSPIHDRVDLLGSEAFEVSLTRVGLGPVHLFHV